jgi:tetratricopeptide (TPR) repeat protein
MKKIYAFLLLTFLFLGYRETSFSQVNEAKQHYTKGNLFARQLMWDEALTEYDLAIEKDNQYVDAFIARAKAYQVRGMTTWH